MSETSREQREEGDQENTLSQHQIIVLPSPEVQRSLFQSWKYLVFCYRIKIVTYKFVSVNKYQIGKRLEWYHHD